MFKHEISLILDNLGRYKHCGPTILADVWNLPEGEKLVVEFNAERQPISNEGGLLGRFLGTIAWNELLCPLNYID